MLHCVGLFHEQSRSDRDSYVNILYNNIQPGMQSQFEKYSPVTIQNLGTSYDYSSIMHYGPTAFSRNGLPTIVPKTQNAQIGQRHGFSQTDVYKINTLYECTPSQPTAATSQPVVTFATTTPSIQTSTTAAPLTNCVNRRPDCKQLADDGWCDRNSKYMRDYCCQTYSSTCSPLTSKTGGSTNKVCEDLRVDCMEQIVKRRYCITAPKFAREVCSKSCGFCWPSVVDENNRATVVPSITAQTLQPIIPKTTTLYPPIVCRDKSFKCVYYKKLGYCIQGAYTKWMLTNCPNSCGVCRNLSPK
ncbi:Metalloendopeptidase [Aphelenchoides besseyi]|nr:Metalloendopeptidase [Aphelenchoides besseyi]